MANIESSKKDIVRIKTRTARNRSAKNKVKTLIKKVDAAVVEGNKDSAVSAFKVVEKESMKVVSKGILHINTVSRMLSRLYSKIKKIA